MISRDGTDVINKTDVKTAAKWRKARKISALEWKRTLLTKRTLTDLSTLIEYTAESGPERLPDNEADVING